MKFRDEAAGQPRARDHDWLRPGHMELGRQQYIPFSYRRLRPCRLGLLSDG